MSVELATAYISLVPSADGLKSKITREISGAGADGARATEREFGRSARRVKTAFATALTTAATGIGAGVVAGLGGAAIANELLSTGAQVEAWNRKTTTVFEGNADDVRKWADRNNETFGLTEANLAGVAANFGDLLKPMGFTSDQAAAMSTDVVGLAGALSEWTGGTRSAAEVSEILAAAMLGEREALKGLGINITEADVQARLAAKGQDKLTGAALEQAKAVATQELIFEKSQDAQKAFADGGNEALRSQNKLKAGLADAKERLSAGLTPALATAATWLADRLPGALDTAGRWFNTLSSWWKEEGPGIRQTASDVFGRVSQVVDEVVATVQRNWPEIQATVEDVMVTVQSVIESVTEIIQTIWNNWGEEITATLRQNFEDAATAVAGGLEFIRGIFATISALFKGDWDAVWDGLVQTVSGAFDFVVGLFQIFWDRLNLLQAAAWDVFTSALDAAWQWFMDLPVIAFQFLVDQLEAMPDRITRAAAGMWDGLKDAFRLAINWVLRKWNELDLTLPEVSTPLGTIGGYTLSTPDVPLIPAFHQGGIYRAPTAGGEGLALLRDGERVLTPEQQAAGGLVIEKAYFNKTGSVIRELDMWSRSQGRRLAMGVLA